MKRIKRYAHITFMLLMLAIAVSVIVYGAVKRAPQNQAHREKHAPAVSTNKRYEMLLHTRV